MRATFCILSLCVLFLLVSARAATDTIGDLPADAARCIGAPDGNVHGELTFAIPAGQGAIGIIDPALGLKPRQSCEVPALLIRLQDQGTVVLKLQILSDGTVADVQVAAPSRFDRLNDAALRLARTELAFSPATNAGMPIDVERLIDVTFRTVTDELWFADPPLKNPAPSEQLAFGLDRLRWGMTSNEVRAFLPTLGPVPPRIGYLAANQSRLFVEDYEYAGCRFELMFFFAGGDHLTTVSVANSDGCALAADVKSRIETELQTRYGTGALHGWKGFVTSGTYGFYGTGPIKIIDIEFHAINAPHIMVF